MARFKSGFRSCPSLVLLLGVVVSAIVSTPAVAGQIANIKSFLEQCPTTDPVYATIRSDFEIRRNGVLVGDIPCAGPISSIPVAQYTDELIVVQGLRTIYYMDLGQSGHLPWAPGSLYAWLKGKIGGIDIRDGSGSFCCESFDGRTFIAVGAQNDANRDFDREWRGISGNIDLYAHEARHLDNFPHSSCCGITNGCDDTFDAASPSCYAVQYLLNKYWLEGTINVGIACLTPSETQAIAQWHQGAGAGFRTRFCTNQPPQLTIPPTPGGPCQPTGVPKRPKENAFLSDANPNPFDRSTRIDFAVSRGGHVSLRIYDVAGHRVGTLVDDDLAPGTYSRSWSGAGQPAGAYFYRLESNGVLGTRKLILVH